MDETQVERGMSRRGVIAGAGAVLAAAGLTRMGSAEAAPSRPSGDGTRPVSPQRRNGSPITSSIASAPTSGYTYAFVGMYDATPFNPQAQRTWGGYGTYTAGVASVLRASVAIPPGALVRDVEYYVYNASGANAVASAYLMVPGMGTITSLAADATILSTGTISAVRVTVPSSARGAFPEPAQLLVSLNTPTTGTVQFNGARVGFAPGPGRLSVLPSPVHVYDSRVHGGKLKAGSTRTITLPASVVPPGTTAVLANVSAHSGTATGYLSAYAANTAKPPGVATLSYTKGVPMANTILLPVSSARQIKVYTDKAVHVVVDIAGTVG